VNYTDPTGHFISGGPKIISGPMGADLGVTAFFMAGMSADLQDPLLIGFELRLMTAGYDVNVVDYWQQRPACTGPCKTDVELAEWSGAKTGLSNDVAKAMAPQIQRAETAGNSVLVIGHSMGGTIGANAVVSLQQQGVHVDSPGPIGGAVADKVKAQIEKEGTPVTDIVGECDKVPELSATYSFVKTPLLMVAGKSSTCHQSPAYFSDEHIDSTITQVQNAKRSNITRV